MSFTAIDDSIVANDVWNAQSYDSATEPIVVLVCGSTEASQEWFEKFYVPLLDVAVADARATFVVGSAGSGVDQFARAYLRKAAPGRYAVYAPEKKRKTESAHLTDFPVFWVNGSYPQRDVHMCTLATHIIAHLSQYGGALSGTALNVYRVVYGVDLTNVFANFRKMSAPFSSDLQQLVISREQDLL